MAKQTFTTGQVLTAAQMTSLQQTAMLGGAASAKTASYTLVAADAGTAISMSNASATTITVNTALFAAGDTIQITNLGAGVCTITAGTATVNSSASLALAQYESGTLDFTSTSAAIFIKGAAGAAASGGMTLINSGGTSLTGASVSISSIPSTYKELKLVVTAYKPATSAAALRVRINGDSNANRHAFSSTTSINNDGNTATFDQTSFLGSYTPNSSTANGISVIQFFDYTNTTIWKYGTLTTVVNDNTTATSFRLYNGTFIYNQTSAISSLDLFPSTGNFTSGTAYLYGVS